MTTRKTALLATPAAPGTGPALRVPRLTRRQSIRERARKKAARTSSFDPNKYRLRARAKRDAAATTATTTATKPAAAPARTPARTSPPPLRSLLTVPPLVLARPLVREGGEDYRLHPSRLLPNTREAYWAGSQPGAVLRSTLPPAPRPARKSKA
ncbi:MAG: hypothetical protein JWN73_5197 [Betaproteobacteria bacterium]|nr:hypothetical protein [Betaproteobacteria bacterium]